MKNKRHKYQMFTFKAIDSPMLCKKYISGHVKVLADFGIENITSNNNTWTLNPDVYCLGLRSENNELLGGIRIQLANSQFPLPIEDAVGYAESKVHEMVSFLKVNDGVGELSGLWVDNRLKGLGVGWYLVRAAIASCNQLNFKTLVGICGDVTLKMFKNVGFSIDTSLGNNGTFYYPNDTLIAYAVGIIDTVTLPNSIEYDKNIMLSLRKNIKIDRVEKDREKEVMISYSLQHSNITEIKLNEDERKQS